MLLSRVADSLYWISRYLERAEHHARVLDVAIDFGLGQPSDSGHRVLERLHGVLGGQPGEDDYDGVLFDGSDRNSVVACVVAARENARQVREEISSDMWEQINALFLRVRQMQGEASRGARTHFVSKAVVDGIHLFHGITDSTMGRGEGWQYLQLGRFLERANATAASARTSRTSSPTRPKACTDARRSTRPNCWRCCAPARRSRRTAGTTRPTSARSG